MRLFHTFLISLVFAFTLGSISPAYSDFHTDYSDLFTIDNRAFIPGGSHTGYSNLFTIDNRLSPPGGSHTGYSNLFTIDNRDSGERLLSSVRVTVSDKVTGKPISGAIVQAGDVLEFTDANGTALLTGIPSGQISLAVEATGYLPSTLQVTVSPSSTLKRQVSLTPQRGGSAPVITKIFSQYTDSGRTSYFLSGTNQNIDFQVDVHWNGSPGKLLFQTSRGNWTASNTQYRLNIKNDFGDYDRLKVVATNAAGVSSEPFDAGIEVVPKPAWIPFYWFYPKGNNDYIYKVTVLPIAPTISIEKDKIPKDIPIVGQSAIRFVDLTQEISGELSSSGAGELGIDFASLGGIDNQYNVPKQLFKKIQIASVEFKPSFNFGGFFQYVDGRGWGINGGYVEVGLDEPAYAKSPPYPFAIPPIPIPFFARGEARLEELAVRLEMIYQQQLELSGSLTMYPAIRGSIGAGVADVASVEGYVQGGVRFVGALPADTPAEVIRELSLRLNGGVKAVLLFLTYERDFLEWKWTLIEHQAKRMWALVPSENQEFKMGILNRDYLSDSPYADFVANDPMNGHGGLRPMSVTPTSEQEESEEFPIQQNVFPYSQPVTVPDGKNIVVLWVADDPNDDEFNRTEIQYSVFDGALWSDPRFVSDDSLSDFRPQLIADGNGNLLAVWERAKETLDRIESASDLTKRMEIAYSTFDSITATWTEPAFITSDDAFDKLPQLSKRPDGSVLLTWVSNLSGEAIGTTAAPDQINYCLWNGAGWTQPKAIASDVSGLMSYSQVSNDSGSILAASLDVDGDSLTRNDVDLFAYRFANDAWSAAERLTENDIPDDTPRLTVDPQGRILLIWQQDGVLVNALDMEMDAPASVLSEQHAGIVGDLTLISKTDGKLALVWSDTQDDRIDLYSAYFDPDHNTWGTASALTKDVSQEYAVAGSFLPSGDLMLVYNKASIEYVTREVMDSDGNFITQTNVPQIVRRDLYGMCHTFGHDLGISSADIRFSTGNPAPGSTVTIEALIHNRGDLTETDIPVAVYDGDPDAGGLPISENLTIAGPIIPGATDRVEVEWTVPSYQGSHRIFVLVNSDSALSERNSNDNQASVLTVLPDPEISSLKAELIGGATWSITATVSNAGVISSASMELVLRKGTDDGAELARYSIEELQPGSSQDYSVSYAMSGDEITAGGVSLQATLFYFGTTPDFNSGNNKAVTAIVPPGDRPPVWVRGWMLHE